MIFVKQKENQAKKQLPINKVEDVEFSQELADQEDLEALKRAQEADRRQQS